MLWLAQYDGPGYYGRKIAVRDARYVYNHILESRMLLWLSAAAGVSSRLVARARRAADARNSMAGKAAAVRAIIPWSLIQERLWVDGSRP